MKNILFNSVMLFAFCFVTQAASAQQVAELESKKETVVKTDKDKLLEKYNWLGNHLKKMKNVKHVTEMQYEGSTDFVIIETSDSKVLYDADGQTYCTESKDLNCVQHYKLTPGVLRWSQS